MQKPKRIQSLFAGIATTHDTVSADQPFTVSLPPPEPTVLFEETTDAPWGRVLALKLADGTIRRRKTDSGAPYVVPKWCGMSGDEHWCAWGCMGIGADFVSRDGRAYCKGCDLYVPDDGEKTFVKYLLKNEEDHNAWEMGQGGEWDDDFNGYREKPKSYPCVAICFKEQGFGEWNQKTFIQHVFYVYPDDLAEAIKAEATVCMTS